MKRTEKPAVGGVPPQEFLTNSRMTYLSNNDLNKSFGSLPGSTGKGASVFTDVAKAAGIDSSGPYTGESYDAAKERPRKRRLQAGKQRQARGQT